MRCAFGVIAIVMGTAGCGSKTGLAIGQPSPRDAGMDAGRPDSGRPDAGRPDAGFDAGLPDAMEMEDAGRPCRRQAPVDLLLVIDDSGSMFEEQTHLAEQLPRLVADLVAPPDEDMNGVPDWLPILDLHLGVVTTGVDEGGGTTVCGSPAPDGILRTTATAPGCAMTYPPFLQFTAGVHDPVAVSADFACVARAGTDGCGVEQPLEAAIKALLPQSAGIMFRAGRPHGDVENAGFLRRLSLVAVVLLTDEEDCSYADPAFLEDEPMVGELPPCLQPDDPLFPVERYESALRSLRTERPDLFAFAVIAGVPERLVPRPTRVDYDTVLADPFMRYRVDPEEPLLGVVPACEGPRGRAFPARRLVQLAQRFGDQAAVASICQESYRPVVGAIARLVGTRACEEFE